MTTAKGVAPDEPMKNDDPREPRPILRIRTTAMGAIPKRTSFAKCAKPAPSDA